MAQSKKTVTTPATPVDNSEALAVKINEAIADDVTKNLLARTSGASVAATFDEVFDGFNWTSFKGNMGAEKCEMEVNQYKFVKLIRTQYRDAWDAADLPNFDQRWKYVVECSGHYVEKIVDPETSGKSTEAKLEECIRGVFRHATTLDAQEEIALALELMSLRGLELKSPE